MTKKQSIIKILRYLYIFSSFISFSTPDEVEALIAGNIPFLAQSLLTQSEPDELLHSAIRNMYDDNLQHLQKMVNALDFSAPHINLLTHINRCIPKPLYRNLPESSVMVQYIIKAIYTPDDRENIKRLNYYFNYLVKHNICYKELIYIIQILHPKKIFKLLLNSNKDGIKFIINVRPNILTVNINMFFNKLLNDKYDMTYSTLVEFYIEAHLEVIDFDLKKTIQNLNPSQLERLTNLLNSKTMNKIYHIKNNGNPQVTNSHSANNHMRNTVSVTNNTDLATQYPNRFYHVIDDAELAIQEAYSERMVITLFHTLLFNDKCNSNSSCVPIIEFYLKKTPLEEIYSSFRRKILELNTSQIERLTNLLNSKTMNKIYYIRAILQSDSNKIKQIEPSTSSYSAESLKANSIPIDDFEDVDDDNMQTFDDVG